jgi:hypothetical protein
MEQLFETARAWLLSSPLHFIGGCLVAGIVLDIIMVLVDSLGRRNGDA